MLDAIPIWSPEDWEIFSFGLLQERHGALNLHKIPAKHKGDLGIDYYCTKELVAYQCYSVEEPIGVADRAGKQNAKITRDLLKLTKNADAVQQLFLGSPIKNWILLVPLHDSKDVNLHCSKKTVDLRNASHNCLDRTFEVGVQDQDAFPANVLTKSLASLSKINFSIPIPTQDDIAKWSEGAPTLLNNAMTKFAKRASGDELQELVDASINWFLEGSALLEVLRTSLPDLHDGVLNAIASRTRKLQLAGPQGGPTPGGILSTELDGLTAAVRVAAPDLSLDQAEKIAYRTVSDWIMRCPLDFQ